MKRLTQTTSAAMLATTGCAAGLMPIGDRTATTSRTEQHSGADLINVAPAITVHGGSVVGMALAAVLAAGMLVRAYLRARRALTAVVVAIETLDGDVAGTVKSQAAQSARMTGVSDYLHATVRKMCRNINN